MSEQYSDDRALDAGVVYPILEMKVSIVTNEGDTLCYLLIAET
jgi:hypothetical protein